jgi:adenosylcobinamide-phosphate synthase
MFSEQQSSWLWRLSQSPCHDDCRRGHLVRWERPVGLLIGYLADRVFGDPSRYHPVAGFGRLAGALERRWYADNRGRGAAYAVTLVGGFVVAGLVAEGSVQARSGAKVVVTAAATWMVLGGQSLEREADAVHQFLAAGDLPGARQRLTHLVGRDTSQLSADEISRAVIESVAENTSDAVVAPLVWGSVAGVPGLIGYRAANTLDAMVGHRSVRYSRFGWASARLDDALNLPGARLAGLLTAVAAPANAGATLAAWRRDAATHPSPNAGVIEAAFAGALDLRLGGTNRYGDQVEHRATMGTGRPPKPDDIGRSVRLSRRVGLLAALVCAGAGMLQRAQRQGPSVSRVRAGDQRPGCHR